jgi:hypothetical protein
VLQPYRLEKDVFPTVYGANTKATLRRLFSASDWHLTTYGWFGDPLYFGAMRPLLILIRIVNWLTPEALAPMLFVFAQRRHDEPV